MNHVRDGWWVECEAIKEAIEPNSFTVLGYACGKDHDWEHIEKSDQPGGVSLLLYKKEVKIGKSKAKSQNIDKNQAVKFNIKSPELVWSWNGCILCRLRTLYIHLK